MLAVALVSYTVVQEGPTRPEPRPTPSPTMTPLRSPHGCYPPLCHIVQ